MLTPSSRQQVLDLIKKRARRSVLVTQSSGQIVDKGHSHASSEISLPTLGNSTYRTLTDFVNQVSSPGRITGGVITSVDATHVSVSAGTGLIRTVNNENSELLFFDWSASASVAISAGVLNYLYVDYNSGVPSIGAVTSESSINRNTQIPIGMALGTQVFTDGVSLPNWVTKEQRRLMECRRMEHASGAAVSSSGTRNVRIEEGVFYAGGTRLTTSLFDSSSSSRFTYAYRNGSSGYTLVASSSQIDNTRYDNGTGTLATLDTGDYGVHWICVMADGSVGVLYGEGSYTLAQAKASELPTAFPEGFSNFGVVAAKMIVLNGAASVALTIQAYHAKCGVTAPSDHNELASLQGGADGDRYHLTSAQATDLTDGGLTSLHAHAGVASGYLVYRNTGDYIKIASVEFTTFGRCCFSIDFVGGVYDLANSCGKLYVSVSQFPIGDTPFVSIRLENHSVNIRPDDITAVTTVNTASATTVEIWLRIESARASRINYFVNAGQGDAYQVPPTFYDGGATKAVLPDGDKTYCISSDSIGAGQPTSTPILNSAWYRDTNTNEMYHWDGTAWYNIPRGQPVGTDGRDE